MFSPNGFETIRPNAAVKIVFDNHPGQIFHANVISIPHGVGEGQVAVSGTMARVGAIGGTKAYPAVISIPDGIDRAQLRVGMPGTATVFSENAGAIGLLMSISCGSILTPLIYDGSQWRLLGTFRTRDTGLTTSVRGGNADPTVVRIEVQTKVEDELSSPIDLDRYSGRAWTEHGLSRVPVLAKLKTVTGRIWTYVRDDRPFGGKDPPAAASITRAVVPGSIRKAILPAMWASCRPMPLMATTSSTRRKGSRLQSLKWLAGATPGGNLSTW